MPLADHDYVVQAFTSNRANHPLGRTRFCQGERGAIYRFSDAQCLGADARIVSPYLVSVPIRYRAPPHAHASSVACRPFGQSDAP